MIRNWQPLTEGPPVTLQCAVNACPVADSRPDRNAAFEHRVYDGAWGWRAPCDRHPWLLEASCCGVYTMEQLWQHPPLLLLAHCCWAVSVGAGAGAAAGQGLPWPVGCHLRLVYTMRRHEVGTTPRILLHFVGRFVWGGGRYGPVMHRRCLAREPRRRA